MDDLRDLSLDRLDSELTELTAHLNAATCRWLCLVAELDRREIWGDWGAKTSAHWLAWRCGLSASAARERLRVARALPELPAIREAFGRGELSYSQVRALCRIATPETEAELVVLALHATASQLETIVRAYRGVLDRALGADHPEHRRRFVHCMWSDNGSLLVNAELPAEEGALLMAALAAGREAVREGASADDSAETTQIGDNADALVLMADTMLAGGPAERTGGDRNQVVVHVDATTLAHDDPEGACEVEHGPALHPETARRLACDASLVRILERDGRPLSVGRKSRTIAPALRRALRRRDAGCRFPGCDHQRFLHAHHLDHWARGGRTDLSNLIQLCSYHHRLVHEDGYAIERLDRGRLRFKRPDGTEILPVPKRRRGDVRALMRANGRRGLAIDSETALTRWDGTRLDLDWQITGMVADDPRLRE